ncbi:MAG: EamA family transporter RarD [Geodermatophilaceae bacterium]|nr:EamA family transporter RarD [Geodermatophilaceae bacterium]
MSEGRRGVLFGVAAYTLWGLFPLYWPLLKPASPQEILAHRFLWSLVFVGVLIAIGHNWAKVRAVFRSRRTTLILSAAAVLIAMNWFTYIYGVNNGFVVETSLGYFINPLVSVVLGVAFFRERLRRAQWVAVALATIAVVVLTVDYGRLPYLALVLAFSFGFYGLLKKLAPVGSAVGLTVESGVLVLPAIALLAVLAARGELAFGQVSLGNTALLISAGVATAVPLLFFASAAHRVSLSTLGILQYLAPTLQLVFGLTVFGEPMPPVRLIGFALVWVALVIFSVDGLWVRRPLPWPEQPIPDLSGVPQDDPAVPRVSLRP